jgi:hypothetical protein
LQLQYNIIYRKGQSFEKPSPESRRSAQLPLFDFVHLFQLVLEVRAVILLSYPAKKATKEWGIGEEQMPVAPPLPVSAY